MNPAEKEDLSGVLRSWLEVRRKAMRESLMATQSSDWGTSTQQSLAAAPPVSRRVSNGVCHGACDGADIAVIPPSFNLQDEPAVVPLATVTVTPAPPPATTMSAAQRRRRPRTANAAATASTASLTETLPAGASLPERVLQHRTNFSQHGEPMVQLALSAAPADTLPLPTRPGHHRPVERHAREVLQRRTSFSVRKPYSSSLSGSGIDTPQATETEQLERRLHHRRRHLARSTRFDVDQPFAAPAAKPLSSSVLEDEERSLETASTSRSGQHLWTRLRPVARDATQGPLTGIPGLPIPLLGLGSSARLTPAALAARALPLTATINADEFFAGTTVAAHPAVAMVPVRPSLPQSPGDGTHPLATQAKKNSIAAGDSTSIAISSELGSEQSCTDFLEDAVPGGGIWNQMAVLQPGRVEYTPKLLQLQRENEVQANPLRICSPSSPLQQKKRKERWRARRETEMRKNRKKQGSLMNKDHLACNRLSMMGAPMLCNCYFVSD